MKKFWAVLGVVGLSATMAVGAAQAATFTAGDVFASVSNGIVQEYSAAGVLVGTLNTGVSGFNTGSAFDSSGNLYVTNFSASSVTTFAGPTDPHTATLFGGSNNTNESIVFNAAGQVYIGGVGSGGIRHFDAAGNLLGSVLAGTRVDWMDLAADQTTMLYTQEGTSIKTVNVVTGVAGPDIASGVVQNAFALRILADGSILVADEVNVKHLTAGGTLIRTYTVGTENTWFSLNLNNDGTSFWSGNFGTGNLYRFDIASGALLQTINTGVGGSALYGVSVFGEVTQGCGANCGGGGGTVPEPASLILLGSGLAALGLRRLRKA